VNVISPVTNGEHLVKDEPMDAINIYCDESCHIPNDHSGLMTLGAISAPQSLVRALSKQIRSVKRDYNCNGELKWTKVSQKNLAFYLALVDLFFDTSQLGFRALVVRNKEQLDHTQYNQGNPDSFYYKMYYYLLRNLVENRAKHPIRIYLDIKDTRSSQKVQRLQKVLANSFYDFQYERVQRVQQVRSHESELMQLCDLLLGAVTYVNRDLGNNQGKIQVARAIEQRARHSLGTSTPPWEPKLNLFHFVPRGE
jgi:hypothetical protein